MKKLVLILVVLALAGWVAACSQGDTHPPLLGDCTGCGSPIIGVGVGGDSGTDGTPSDGTASDVTTSDVTTSDVTQDAPDDTSALDTGTSG